MFLVKYLYNYICISSSLLNILKKIYRLGSFYSNEKLNNIGIDLSNPPVVPDENDQYTKYLILFFFFEYFIRK